MSTYEEVGLFFFSSQTSFLNILYTLRSPHFLNGWLKVCTHTKRDKKLRCTYIENVTCRLYFKFFCRSVRWFSVILNKSPSKENNFKMLQIMRWVGSWLKLKYYLYLLLQIERMIPIFFRYQVSRFFLPFDHGMRVVAEHILIFNGLWSSKVLLATFNINMEFCRFWYDVFSERNSERIQKVQTILYI